MDSSGSIRSTSRMVVGRLAATFGLMLACIVAAEAGPAASVSPGLADDRLEASYNAGDNFVRYPTLDIYLKGITHRLEVANPDAAGFPLRLHALKSELPYAFVLDNGAAYVSTGLIARLDSEQELAAMIALPYAAVVRHDRQSLSEGGRRHEAQSFLPNLLLITATAGLGAIALIKADNKKHEEERLTARAASDAVALGWLAAAGYDPKAAATALVHLRERLDAEQRHGVSPLSDPDALASRATSLEIAAAAVAEVRAPASPIDPGLTFRRLSNYYALEQARLDLDNYRKGVVPILDRVEARDGESGLSALLRADYVRVESADDAKLPAAIAAYQRATSHPDVPVDAHRELGLLYRRAGDAVHARESFATYLAKAPSATDAPIIRTYLEDP